MLLVKLLHIFLLLSVANASQRTGSRSRQRPSQRKESGASATNAGRSCNGVPSVPNQRRACNFFVWDLRSAVLYKWCHHLLKDHIYEGKGGHLFVRYESNSILQLLYPCSRYAPNQCLTCGGHFTDHLHLWWSKHLYTPFDRHIDNTYQDGLKLIDGGPERRGRRSSSSKESTPEVVGKPIFTFHRRYVQDVSDMIYKTKENRKSKFPSMTLTQFPSIRLAYVTPTLPKDGKGKRSSFTLRLARKLCMDRLENLIELQEIENKR